MLILAVDTSGKNGSLALVRFDREAQQTLAIVPLEGGTFSAQLIPQIATLLEQQQVSKRDIDAFAVASGPGSFTGLRVGLAAIKALAEVLQRPIVAVSLLEAVARSAQHASGRTLAVLDAGRGELYVGRFEVQNGTVTCIREDLRIAAEFVHEAERKFAVATEQKVADLLGGSNVTLVTPPRADTIARLGYEKLRAGESVPPEALDALYIRRSDAEMKLGK
jgi:tRNA threonylcarbamoyladenosine biosynthesis protein TsaB